MYRIGIQLAWTEANARKFIILYSCHFFSLYAAMLLSRNFVWNRKKRKSRGSFAGRDKRHVSEFRIPRGGELCSSPWLSGERRARSSSRGALRFRRGVEKKEKKGKKEKGETARGRGEIIAFAGRVVRTRPNKERKISGRDVFPGNGLKGRREKKRRNTENFPSRSRWYATVNRDENPRVLSWMC